jgi:putative ABC transport system permease protein
MTVLKTSLRNFFAHKGRMLLSGMAVVLSVAFVCGTLVFTATMNTTFDNLFSDTASSVMVGPAEEEDQSEFDSGPTNGRPETFDASVADEVAAVPGVERVTGVLFSESAVAVNEDNENLGPTMGAPTILGTWSDIELRSMEIAEGAAPEGPDQVMIDGDTADKHDVAVGDPIRLITVEGDFPMTVSGIADFTVTNPGAAVLYTDLRTAQQMLLGGESGFSQLYVDSDGSVTDAQLKDAVAAAIGADAYKIQTAQEYADENRNEIGEILSVLEYVLLGFAGIAVLVGIFLIVNTFSMLVAQRTREIGLMRAVGASRRQVNRSVLTEALLLGVLGSLVGFVAGIGVAVGLMGLMGMMGMNLSTDDLTIGWNVPVIGVVLGVVVTVLSAYIPARRAGRISPMAALRDAGMPGDVRAGRIRAGIGLVFTVAGLGALVATASADDASGAGSLLGLGVPLTLIGLVLAGPMLVGFVVRGLSAVLLRIFGPVGRLAERNALRNPRRTGATASALMIGLALVAGLSVMGSSMVASANDEIDRTMGADYVITSASFTPISPVVTEAVSAMPELDHVTAYREVEIDATAPDGTTTDARIGAVDPTFTEDFTVDVLEGDLADALAPGGISVDPDYAAEHGIALGDAMTVAFQLPDGQATEPVTLTVQAVVSGDSSFLGAWYVGRETAEQAMGDGLTLPMQLMASARDGQEDAARAALDAVMEPYPQIEVRDQAEFKGLVEQQVGQLLNMVYGLLALAIIVAVLGVVNTLALSVVERTREIGLMRAIGLSRRQLRRMIRLESVVIALFGALLGLGLGMTWGWAGHQILTLEGMPVLEIPWVTIVLVFVGSAIVGLLAALLPAFRAGRMNVLNAIATE